MNRLGRKALNSRTSIRPEKRKNVQSGCIPKLQRSEMNTFKQNNEKDELLKMFFQLLCTCSSLTMFANILLYIIKLNLPIAPGYSSSVIIAAPKSSITSCIPVSSSSAVSSDPTIFSSSAISSDPTISASELVEHPTVAGATEAKSRSVRSSSPQSTYTHTQSDHNSYF
jgi:hypothetical protein